MLTRHFNIDLAHALQINKHCYICHQTSTQLICKHCITDAHIAHLPVPGFDILQQSRYAEHLLPPYYHHFYALAEYSGMVKRLINRLKFSHDLLAAQVLSTLFMQFVYPRIEQLEDLPEAFIPLPLSNLRYLNRGYNQARILAQHLSKKSQIRVIDGLKRTKHTLAQSKLDKEQRAQNIHNAFALARKLNFQHVGLVDDVVTTGATINSACKTIVEAYPDIRISVWAMAVTPLKRRS